MRNCEKNNVPVGEAEIRVTTLHSLALAILARADMLDAYPVRPLHLSDELSAMQPAMPGRAVSIC